MLQPSLLHSAFWEPPPKGCINRLHLPELSQGWQDLLGHPACPCCWLSWFMSQDLPPPHNSFLQGVLIPSKAVGRQKLQPDHPDLSPGPGTLVPLSQGCSHGSKAGFSRLRNEGGNEN